MTALQQAIEQQGLAILPRLLSADRVACLVSDLYRSLPEDGASVLRSQRHVYGIRNLIDVWPPALSVAQEPVLREVLATVLGEGYGLVRSIFFDKPPGRTWSLPWHRDMTIAVRDAGRAGGEFGRATVKAGIPHVEAPVSLLRRMLTARIALDDVTAENGPLLVIPGSHSANCGDRLPSKRDLASRAHPVHVHAGDVFLIRPLVVHRSGPSDPNTTFHRRTLHFEFASEAALPDGLEWHQFIHVAP